MDYLESLERYTDIKEDTDVYNDAKKLREYYYERQYDRIQQHIQSLMLKYLAEAVIWNSSHAFTPQTPEQFYQNAEAFLSEKHKY